VRVFSHVTLAALSRQQHKVSAMGLYFSGYYFRRAVASSPVPGGRNLRPVKNRRVSFLKGVG